MLCIDDAAICLECAQHAMLWHPLGHAMALAEVDGLRLLFDPLLSDRHHGGVFEVVPPRAINAGALRADFVFVSHRHPDHFDLPSLRRLAELDPDSVVITPDALIERCCKRLGFRTVRKVAPRTRIELDTVCVVTTPSRANDDPIDPEALEWGIAIKGHDGVVWNRVDTVYRDRADLNRTVDDIERALDGKLSLALVPWCPLLEVDALTAGSIGFPFRAYSELLEDAAAIAARGAAIVPGSAGARHAAPYDAMNALVYPVSEQRFLRDLRARVPGARAFPLGVGGTFEIEGEVRYREGCALIEVRAHVDERDFDPLAIPEVIDANLDGREEPRMRTAIDAWLRTELAPRLTGRTFLLEVVFPGGREAWTFRDRACAHRADPEWDLRNEVAASLLCDVIEGRRHWGDVLLAGALRGCSRAYDVGARGLVRANVSPIFLYEAISYTASVERAVEHELSHDG
jgi:L-ascorbate metabolism protein UlaG (beta-lactamase superfamily)